MKVLKYVLIAICVTVTIGVAALTASGIFAYHYVNGVPAMQASDFEIGTPATPPERQALINACTKAKNASTEGCGCLAEAADKRLSRFDRLFMTATYDSDLKKIAALGVGAAKADLPKDKEPFDSVDTRVKPLLAECHLPLSASGKVAG